MSPLFPDVPPGSSIFDVALFEMLQIKINQLPINPFRYLCHKNHINDSHYESFLDCLRPSWPIFVCCANTVNTGKSGDILKQRRLKKEGYENI
jgi:hypothetical protein